MRPPVSGGFVVPALHPGHGAEVRRLRVFGSAVTDRFDPERIFGYPVDLVMSEAVRNLFFRSARSRPPKNSLRPESRVGWIRV